MHLDLNYVTMKKTVFALIVCVIMIGFASCGNNNKHSKAFNESKQVLDKVMESVKQSNDCDELDMATFRILGLLGVEGVDEMPEAEQEELSKITEDIEKVLEQKKAEFNCEEDFFDSDELPMDEWTEEETE